MSVKNLLLFIIIFFLHHTANANYSIEFIIKDLPDNILLNQSHKKQIVAKIINYAHLNPELIYFIIQNEIFKHEKKINNPDSNYTNILNAIISKNKSQRNKWAQLEIESIDKNITLEIEAYAIKSYYENFSYSVKKEFKYENYSVIDSNMIDYYCYLFFNPKSNEIYNSNTNYFELGKSEIIKKVEYFIKNYNASDFLSRSEKLDLVSEALEYPYLFLNSYLNKYSTFTPFRLHEFINKMIHQDFLNKHSIDISLFSSIHTFDIKSKVYFKDLRFPYTIINGNVKTNAFPIINVGLSYKFILEDYKKGASFIKLDFGGSIVNLTDINSEVPDVKEVESYLPGTKAFLGTYKTRLKNDTYFTLSSNLYTPLFFLSEVFYFTTGINYTFVSHSFEYEISRQAVNQYSDDPIDLNNDTKNIKVSKEEHYISPYLALNYSFLPTINLRIEAFHYPISLNIVVAYSIFY